MKKNEDESFGTEKNLKDEDEDEESIRTGKTDALEMEMDVDVETDDCRNVESYGKTVLCLIVFSGILNWLFLAFAPVVILKMILMNAIPRSSNQTTPVTVTTTKLVTTVTLYIVALLLTVYFIKNTDNDNATSKGKAVTKNDILFCAVSIISLYNIVAYIFFLIDTK